MAIGRGNFSTSQKLTVFGVMFGIAVLGIGIPLLAVKLFSLAYFTIFALAAACLLGALTVFHVLFITKDLNKKMFLMIKVAIFVSVFYISLVVFTNVIGSGAINMDFVRNWF